MYKNIKVNNINKYYHAYFNDQLKGIDLEKRTRPFKLMKINETIVCSHSDKIFDKESIARRNILEDVVVLYKEHVEKHQSNNRYEDCKKSRALSYTLKNT